MLKKVFRHHRFWPGMVCIVILVVLGFWFSIPQTKSFACPGPPCMNSSGPCGGIGGTGNCALDGDGICGGSCTAGCAAGPAHQYCAGTTSGCQGYGGVCSPEFKYVCGIVGANPCDCKQDTRMRDCTLSACE